MMTKRTLLPLFIIPLFIFSSLAFAAHQFKKISDPTQSRVDFQCYDTAFLDESWRLPINLFGSGTGTSTIFIDVEGDGDDDLFIASGSPWWVGEDYLATLWINDGTGVFQDESIARMPADGLRQVVSVGKGDIDGDGDLDLYITAGNSNDPKPDYLYVNDGNGYFTNEWASRVDTGDTVAWAVEFADVDQDQDLDIILGLGSDVVEPNPTAQRQTRLLLNDGTGHFQDVHADRLPSHRYGVMAIDSGDIDGDDDIDLVLGVRTGIESDGQNRIWINDGNGYFSDTPALYPSLQDQTLDIVLEDLNGDEYLDIFVANGESANSAQNRLLLNDGAGLFSEAPEGHLPTMTDESQMVAVEDFDQDGDPDLVVANMHYSEDDPGFVFLLNDGGIFTDETPSFLPDIFASYRARITAGNVNGDSFIDICIPPFADATDPFLLLMNGLADTDEDGWLICQNDCDDDNPTVCPLCPEINNNGIDDDCDGVIDTNEPLFDDAGAYGTGGLSYSVATGDFDEDENLDIVVATKELNSIAILIGYGDGTFEDSVHYDVGTGPVFVAVGDFDGDDFQDIVVANQDGDDVAILLGIGDGTFEDSVFFGVGISPIAVAVGDFDGNIHDDLAVVNQASNTVSILLGNGDGTFQQEISSDAVGNDPRAIDIGDFDKDENQDLVVVRPNEPQNGNFTILFGNGDGTFDVDKDYIVGYDPRYVSTGDFDGDGFLDMAVVHDGQEKSVSTLTILLGNGDGTFEEERSIYYTGLHSRYMAVEDLDSDEQQDLIVSNEIGKSVSIFLNIHCDNDADGFQDEVCGGLDCNDSKSNVNPDADEICFNGNDDDCDGVVDGDFDMDEDGFTCNVDCDDSDPAIPMDNEICYNGIDDDCDGVVDGVFDMDEDGFWCNADCDDGNPNINPAVEESVESGNCEDGIDNDCDNIIDLDPECEGCFLRMI